MGVALTGRATGSDLVRDWFPHAADALESPQLVISGVAVDMAVPLREALPLDKVSGYRKVYIVDALLAAVLAILPRLLTLRPAASRWSPQRMESPWRMCSELAATCRLFLAISSCIPWATPR